MPDKRIVALGIVVLLVVGYVIYSRLVPDETRIRWLVEETIEGYNEARAGSCVAALAEDYRDSSTGLRKAELRGYLGVLFLKKQNIDPETGLFRYPAEVPPESLVISIREGEPPTAEVKAKVLFRRLEEREGPPLWEVDVVANLTKSTGEWLVERSRHRTLSGRPPF